MDLNVAVFAVLAAIALAAAVKVVTSPSVMHAALWLAGAFVAVAGVYFVLSAEFIGVVQLLVYAGAVTTLIVFAVMLSDARSSDPLLSRRRTPLVPISLAIAVILGGSLVGTLVTAGWTARNAPPPDSVGALGRLLFTELAVPNEVVSVILLVALVGAIALTVGEDGR